jgi:hypothetical protein
MAREEEWEDKDWGDFMWGKETKPFLDFEVAPGIELRMHQNLAGTPLCRKDTNTFFPSNLASTLLLT